MKYILPIIAATFLVSCKKDTEVITENKVKDSAIAITDSSAVKIESPDYAGVFKIVPLNISAEKGRAIFTQAGKTLFYFDQNSNKGNIKIDGKDYPLIRVDFNENNYSLYGDDVKIEASNGDFKDSTGDCVYGSFPEVKVSLNDKALNLTDIGVQDCPNY